MLVWLSFSKLGIQHHIYLCACVCIHVVISEISVSLKPHWEGYHIHKHRFCKNISIESIHVFCIVTCTHVISLWYIVLKLHCFSQVEAISTYFNLVHWIQNSHYLIVMHRHRTVNMGLGWVGHKWAEQYISESKVLVCSYDTRWTSLHGMHAASDGIYCSNKHSMYSIAGIVIYNVVLSTLQKLIGLCPIQASKIHRH